MYFFLLLLQVPELVTPPSNVVVLPGERALLHCQVVSQPVASVEWYRNGVSLFSPTMPGDDSRRLVHKRGGPQKYMVSTWLDINGVTEGDAGVYECHGSNMYGMTTRTASITVQTDAGQMGGN